MQVHEIKISASLPPLSEWLDPAYTSEGDLILRRAAGEKANDPRNWREDFPAYDYEIPELVAIKQRLNETKRRQDEVNSDPHSAKLFARIVAAGRKLEDLRGPRGILAREYGAEIVTNAWLKMYEAMSLLEPVVLRAAKRKDHTLRTFHFAEAPGNFILAINHWLASAGVGARWDWRAETYRDVTQRHGPRDTYYLSDQYGLIAGYPNNWLFGADGDGDITSPANIRTFRQQHPQCDFVTSDVKYMPPSMDYDEEERINLPVHLGHTLCAVNTLRKDGCALLKELTLFEAPSLCRVMLMLNSFNRVCVVKPESSREANSEIYVFGSGFRDNLSTLQSERLFKILSYIRPLGSAQGSPALFRREHIPDVLVKRMTEIGTVLADHQIRGIERNLRLYETYKSASDPVAAVRADCAKAKAAAAAAWIARVGIKPLPEEVRMMRGKKRNPQ